MNEEMQMQQVNQGLYPLQGYKLICPDTVEFGTWEVGNIHGIEFKPHFRFVRFNNYVFTETIR